MGDFEYRRVREVMWSEKRYGLRDLPDFYGFPLLVKLMKKTQDLEQKRSFNKDDILRIHGEEMQRRLIAVDSGGRHWSFPVHIGAKFEVAEKKGNRTMFLSEMVELKKLPKKFRFAQKEQMQVKISGEDRASAAPIIAGDFKPKEIVKLRVFKANKIEQDEIDPSVIFLPAYLDLEVTIATKLACETDEFWEGYMDAMTCDILSKVNMNMYRGRSDIQIYFFPEKTKKSKESSSIYEELPPTVSVVIGNRKRSSRSSKSKQPGETRSLSSMSSFGSLDSNSSFAPGCGPVAEVTGPRKSILDILQEKTDKDDAEKTEEELKRERHRKMILAMLAQEEEEEQAKAAREGGAMPERRSGGDDDADGVAARADGDGNEVDESDSSSISTAASLESGQSSRGDESSDSRPSSYDDGAANRPHSPSDRDGPPMMSTPASPNDVESESARPRVKPKVPARRSPAPTVGNVASDASEGNPTSPVQKKAPPAPSPKPKPGVPGPKPHVRPKLFGPKPVGPKPPGPKPPPRRKPAVAVTSGAHASSTHSSAAHSQFTTLRDFPVDLSGLTIQDMCTALRLMKLDKYEQAFQDHHIDGDMAKELSEELLANDLGISGLDSKKLSRFIHHNWRPM